uniref:Uncharacterized protein n=1 Tax=Laticauda laticaudata TaxID=8630 RepID=A0A8C5S5F5_LATLA
MTKTALEEPPEEVGGRWASASKEWRLKFLRSPLEVLPTMDGKRARAIQLAVNRLEGAGDAVKAVPTGEIEELRSGLIFSSIGYKSLPIDPAVPFDSKRGVIPNNSGRVLGAPGLYCSGWVKRGPTGVIITTMNDSFDTAQSVLEDLQSGALQLSSAKEGSDLVSHILRSRGVYVRCFKKAKISNTSLTTNMRHKSIHPAEW